MSPILKAALDEEISEMHSRESALAATTAQRHLRLARKENVHDPHLELERYALRLLCGLRMIEQVDDA